MSSSDTYPHECKLEFHFSSPEEAELVANSVKIDNPDFITLEVEGNILRSKISAPTLTSMINSLDDYLACLALAEKIIKEEK